jgi:hypothetical protein
VEEDSSSLQMSEENSFLDESFFHDRSDDPVSNPAPVTTTGNIQPF